MTHRPHFGQQYLAQYDAAKYSAQLAPALRRLEGEAAHYLVRTFLHTHRYIDDVSTLMNPYFTRFKYNNITFAGFRGIYSHMLTITNA